MVGVHVFTTSTKPTRLISSPEPWWTMKISTAEDLIYTSLCYSDLLLFDPMKGTCSNHRTLERTLRCAHHLQSHIFIYFSHGPCLQWILADHTMAEDLKTWQVAIGDHNEIPPGKKLHSIQYKPTQQDCTCFPILTSKSRRLENSKLKTKIKFVFQTCECAR